MSNVEVMDMKKMLILTLVFCGLLSFAGSSWAIMAGSTDVGSLDTFVASTILANSSDQSEINWINSVLGTSYLVSDYTKFEMQYDGEGWIATDQAGVWAFDMNNDPDYFLIKLGAGAKDPPTTHLLFANNAEFYWAVVALSGGNDYVIKNVGKISHIGFGDGTKVPEPASFLLMGMGLLGLGLFGRKKI